MGTACWGLNRSCGFLPSHPATLPLVCPLRLSLRMSSLWGGRTPALGFRGHFLLLMPVFSPLGLG